MRSLVLAAIGSFLCGSAASVAPDDVRSHAVAFNQSTLLRLHDAAPGDPGPLKSHGKAVGTTASVGPRLLPDSAVDGTGLDNEQREERGFDPVKSLHSLRDDMWVFLTRRSPASVFDKFVRPKEPVTRRAIVQWLEYVDTPEAKNFYYSGKGLFQDLRKKIPLSQKIGLLDLLAVVATEMHAATSRRPSSALNSDKLNAILLKPRAALKLFDHKFIITEPMLAMSWIRYNEAVRQVDPDSAVPLAEIASRLFVHNPSKGGPVLDGHTKAVGDFLTRLWEKLSRDENFQGVVKELQAEYDKVLKETRTMAKDPVDTKLATE
ncbi:unnamed protein product [Hyaloperonospora brassicae]|uniref:RxLR effector candidate protein n=1 Tax=Hyaloperonospora brassicae TaxID=162125 RepID=A0AAV0THG0_HYABA|nr:unnamed protein product [Hyaloperonospora brassicae]